MGASSSSHSFVAAAYPIEGGLKDGHLITIKGTFLKALGTRFAVNFHMGFSNDDIAFQFNPRFEDSRCVVCKTTMGCLCKHEEKIMRNPFEMGKPFEIRILVEISHFQVMVDGVHFLDYEHLVPFHRVNYMTITGPVEHIDISVQDTRAVRVQKMVSEVQSYPSPSGSPESEEEQPKPPSYWQATAPPIE